MVKIQFNIIKYKGLNHRNFNFYDYFCTAKLGQNHTSMVRKIQGNIFINALVYIENIIHYACSHCKST